jgi:hypothetical protein
MNQSPDICPIALKFRSYKNETSIQHHALLYIPDTANQPHLVLR